MRPVRCIEISVQVVIVILKYLSALATLFRASGFAVHCHGHVTAGTPFDIVARHVRSGYFGLFPARQSNEGGGFAGYPSPLNIPVVGNQSGSSRFSSP